MLNQQISVNETRVGVDIGGSGPPLILVHGSEGDRSMWQGFCPHLSGLTWIAYDQRDSGLSDDSSEGYDVAALADDCASLITALGFASAHVFGVSFGGMIAQEVALRHPNVVQSLSLGVTTPGGQLAAQALEQLRVSAESVGAHLSVKARNDFMGSLVFSPDYARGHPEALNQLNHVLVTRTADQLARRHASAATFDTMARLEHLDVPVLLLAGAEDQLMPPSQSQWMADRIPGATLHVLPGLAHGITLQAPELVAGLVSDFVLAHEPPLRDKESAL